MRWRAKCYACDKRHASSEDARREDGMPIGPALYRKKYGLSLIESYVATNLYYLHVLHGMYCNQCLVCRNNCDSLTGQARHVASEHTPHEFEKAVALRILGGL